MRRVSDPAQYITPLHIIRAIHVFNLLVRSVISANVVAWNFRNAEQDVRKTPEIAPRGI